VTKDSTFDHRLTARFSRGEQSRRTKASRSDIRVPNEQPQPAELRVLFIEDDDRVLYSVGRWLESNGFRVEPAPDGELGLVLARGRQYDVILLDLPLPKRSGIDVLRQLRLEGVWTPVVILTGRGAFDSALEAGRLGVSAYFPKPPVLDDLTAALRTAAERARTGRSRSGSIFLVGAGTSGSIVTLLLNLEARPAIERDQLARLLADTASTRELTFLALRGKAPGPEDPGCGGAKLRKSVRSVIRFARSGSSGFGRGYRRRLCFHADQPASGQRPAVWEIEFGQHSDSIRNYLMALRTTATLAAVALALSVAGTVPAAAVLHGGPSSGLDGRFLWVLVPVLSSAGVLLLARRRNPESVWALTGMSWGFVVLSMLSFGPLFGPSALLLFFAAIVHTVTIRAKWRTVLLPVWFLAGATAVCVLFLARDRLWEVLDQGSITSAPAVAVGARVFVGVAVFLGISTPIVLRLERTRVPSRSRPDAKE